MKLNVKAPSNAPAKYASAEYCESRHPESMSTSGLSGSGETNTASNVGTAGVGIFDGKVGEDLQFKKINAGSSKITITDDTSNNEVDIDFGTVSIADLSDNGFEL